MNYEKNAIKHYEYLVSVAKTYKDRKKDLYFDAWTLYALCKYFAVCGKPAAFADDVSENVIDPAEPFNPTDAKSVKAYTVAAKALCLYAKTSFDETAQKKSKEYRTLLLDGFFSTEAEQSGNDDLSEAYCGALTAFIGTCDEEKQTTFKIAEKLLPKFQNGNLFSDSESMINGAIGLLSLSSKDFSVLEIVSKAAMNYAAENTNLDYTYNISVNEPDTADPCVTSLALTLYTLLYKKTGQRFFLYMARRVWFNGMQFFQRRGGFVGYNKSPRGDGILAVKTYKEEGRTPHFCEGLCTYEQNKELFCEYDAPVKKDPRGRYIMDDKVFAKELGEYFGRDLIEIPSLLSFDEETACEFKFKLLF